MKYLFIAILMITTTSAFAIKCKDFRTHAEAQAYFNAKKPGYKRLDRDKDGSACDCLPGGNGKHCPRRK